VFLRHRGFSFSVDFCAQIMDYNGIVVLRVAQVFENVKEKSKTKFDN
jgi:hypothetical protein